MVSREKPPVWEQIAGAAILAAIALALAIAAPYLSGAR
jgi:hypothetical protein